MDSISPPRGAIAIRQVVYAALAVAASATAMYIASTLWPVMAPAPHVSQQPPQAAPQTALAAQQAAPATDPQPAPVRKVEFLSLTEHPALLAALEASCATSGCDGNVIGALVVSSADGMTANDLRTALATQMVQVDRLKAEADATNDPDSSRRLALQWAAESQIAEFYRSELDLR